MLRLITYVLQTSAEDEKALSALLHAYNSACDKLAEIALESPKQSYKFLSGAPRKKVQRECRLKSGLANGACHHVAWVCKGIGDVPEDEIAARLIFEDENPFVFYNKDTVAFGFLPEPRIPRPTEIDRMPLKLSLTTLDRSRRLFDYGIRVVTIGEEQGFWRDNRMVLAHENGEWLFIAAREMSDKQLAHFRRVRVVELEDEEPIDHPADIDREPEPPADIDEDYMPAVDD